MTADLPALPAPIDFVARWRDIVGRRRAQMDAAYARAGIANTDYWARRAKNYREALHTRTDEDPFLRRVRDALNPESTVLDVGAGTGRHTLALARNVRRVVAVDPSAAMLAFLRRDAAEARLHNVEVIESEWMNADVEPADVVLCSHVLYPIANIVAFVRRLDAHATRRVFMYLRADPLPTDLGLWAEFHGGVELQAQPTHLDAYNVLAQIGILADVEVVTHPFTWTFGDIEQAVDQVANAVCLGEGDTAARAKLRGLLEARLVAWPDGRLGPRVGSARSGIISWTPERPTDRRSRALGDTSCLPSA